MHKLGHISLFGLLGVALYSAAGRSLKFSGGLLSGVCFGR